MKRDESTSQRGDGGSSPTRPEAGDDLGPEADRGPLQRWSRRKRGVLAGDPVDAGDAPVPAASTSDVAGGAGGREPSPVRSGGEAPAEGSGVAGADARPLLADADMPALDELDENSDYSGFLSKGVSSGLRRAALRQLFTAAKFNLRDGLDDYDEDFTRFEALTDALDTASPGDMRSPSAAEREPGAPAADDGSRSSRAGRRSARSGTLGERGDTERVESDAADSAEDEDSAAHECEGDGQRADSAD
ncbi:MAG: DUF3306 domain-containing protein [Gammaproteobacteria bacterium]|nr:DUF3306 domain-containing protein [Gammaproteobacteria bacterium]